MGLRPVCVALVAVVALCLGQARAADVALVMSVQGRVLRQADLAAVPLEAFVKVGGGERISLADDARVQLLYFASGREETWSGPGRLEMTASEGRPEGLAAPTLRTQPLVMARQLARTPAPDGNGRKVPTRTRAVPAPDAMARLEATYQDLRSRAGADDLAPEMYLLSGLFELRELERVEKLLADLRQERPKNPEAALLVALYRKAVRNAREAQR